MEDQVKIQDFIQIGELVNGSWIIGSAIEVPIGGVVMASCNKKDHGITLESVIPKSIGYYTGITDAVNNPVFTQRRLHVFEIVDKDEIRPLYVCIPYVKWKSGDIHFNWRTVECFINDFDLLDPYYSNIDDHLIIAEMQMQKDPLKNTRMLHILEKSNHAFYQCPRSGFVRFFKKDVFKKGIAPEFLIVKDGDVQI